MAKIKTIGILTSGGDAPGMNAAIRAVTRAGISNGFIIKAIYRGYDGLINGEVKPFTTENVSGIINQGGTILKTARSAEFMTDEGLPHALRAIGTLPVVMIFSAFIFNYFLEKSDRHSPIYRKSVLLLFFLMAVFIAGFNSLKYHLFWANQKETAQAFEPTETAKALRALLMVAASAPAKESP